MSAWHVGAHCKGYLHCLLETVLGTVRMLKYLTKWIAKSLIFKGDEMLEDVDEHTQIFWNPSPSTYFHLQKSTYLQKSGILGTKLPTSLAYIIVWEGSQAMSYQKNSILLGAVSKSKEFICLWQSLSSLLSLYKYFKNNTVKYGFLILSVLKLMQPIIFCMAWTDLSKCTRLHWVAGIFKIFFLQKRYLKEFCKCIFLRHRGHFTWGTINSQHNFHTRITH